MSGSAGGSSHHFVQRIVEVDDLLNASFLGSSLHEFDAPLSSRSIDSTTSSVAHLLAPLRLAQPSWRKSPISANLSNEQTPGPQTRHHGPRSSSERLSSERRKQESSHHKYSKSTQALSPSSPMELISESCVSSFERELRVPGSMSQTRPPVSSHLPRLNLRVNNKMGQSVKREEVSFCSDLLNDLKGRELQTTNNHSIHLKPQLINTKNQKIGIDKHGNFFTTLTKQQQQAVYSLSKNACNGVSQNARNGKSQRAFPTLDSREANNCNNLVVVIESCGTRLRISETSGRWTVPITLGQTLEKWDSIRDVPPTYKSLFAPAFQLLEKLKFGTTTVSLTTKNIKCRRFVPSTQPLTDMQLPTYKLPPTKRWCFQASLCDSTEAVLLNLFLRLDGYAIGVKDGNRSTQFSLQKAVALLQDATPDPSTPDPYLQSLRSISNHIETRAVLQFLTDCQYLSVYSEYLEQLGELQTIKAANEDIENLHCSILKSSTPDSTNIQSADMRCSSVECLDESVDVCMESKWHGSIWRVYENFFPVEKTLKS